ncbi:MAG: hypothetical protein K9M07_03300 [Simkaniaceae bacterium]|nr:hypothetical protein [Simkaniaceae bacterium]MCF7852250.1 hypothetical protein [Simkaniaceae bacterium]
MMKLKKFQIESKFGINYFKSNLLNTNALSSKIINSFNLNNGNFFTYLPSHTHSDQIIKFKNSGIASQTRMKTAEILLKKTTSNKYLTCIFDDVSSSFHSGYSDPLFLSHGIRYNEEIYYYLNYKNISKNLILDCLYASNSLWHSLCIIVEYSLENQKELTTEIFEELLSHTKLILIGAYDGEGYIFWEPDKKKEGADISLDHYYN